jgi:uncharacterized protein (TIGR00251 family)
LTAWRATPEGVALRLKVQPKSRRPGFQGLAEAIDGPRLRLGVTEAPEDGRANRAVCETLARALGVPVAAVAVLQGAASREKTVAVAGDSSALIGKLETLA